MNLLRDQKTINSALWAAAGDAIGWISELTDKNGLKHRTGSTYLLKPVGWNRKIGGYSGVTVSLPAGTYSDDTQLRLAVSRAIRDNGEFDIESFAKIELPVWLSYALGAGRATKWAANNLMRKDTTWFSNFYKTDGTEYINAGGNGTAMRVQPHVWSCKDLSQKSYSVSVIKDSLVTHGHLLAVCGAILHADTLQYALLNGRPANISELEKIIDDLSSIPDLINSIYELKNFWLPNWEIISQKNLHEEVERIRIETKELLSKTVGAINKSIEPSEKFKSAISALECDKESRRGTATNTAIASSLLCYIFKDLSPYEAIISCVNELGTDTDSIASMAGAIFGCYNDIPKWDIQDSQYIIEESIRLNKISQGVATTNFSYPNINKWFSPQTQSDSLVQDNAGSYYVLGLGKANALNGDSWKTKTHVWQWVKLEFGQTILIKSKIGDLKTIETPELRNSEPLRYNEPSTLPKATQNFEKDFQSSFDYGNKESSNLDIDEITTVLIKEGFNEQKIGHFLIELADKKGLESCIAFAAIIGKAFITRKKK
ncbi:ADP-ribosylglycohydrolase family protein [Yersinia enterocolitica]|uniref:ADP-ribosylglycohydrolase family protein n=1 Tax=Yersinia enterocolitica TaxID=630 RepID=UPI00155AA7ED|nr:ADP-ribosylglycohydrolase family protein [Yersinia enterocolitica]MBX9485813.1 ADP-ribosylglycohydrolase family protein [Yersinia enterocolitica]NQS96726.1 ADP-ribosylglycohydrolase family protein [Yersinia enterocolitica]NQT43403.1 ADP-ribosylglycohydrolase family protein [Yersinia enterocolitica]NQT98797.1 ADP-ribosylglycohydrolase family protein [Yersinia enterocolitica]HDM8448663.1 ADP-ribosylglycohydrolase family protein [Yersinia enterocolitica]